MSQCTLEAYLAMLYTDAAERDIFLADPETAARNAGLSTADVIALRNIDQAGLRMAADSYARKRAQRQRPGKKTHELLLSWWKRQTGRWPNTRA